MAQRNYELPAEFLDAADRFVTLANELGADRSSDWVRAMMMYATARYSAFTWLTRHPPPMRRWPLPEYIEDILPAEAARVERLRRRVLDLFAANGYLLVIPFLPHRGGRLAHDAESTGKAVSGQRAGTRCGAG